MEQYETILTKQLTSDAILTAIVILLFIAISIGLYVEYKKLPKGQEKIGLIVVFILVACLAVGSSIYGLTGVSKIKKDVDNQDYIVYYGEYQLEKHKSRYHCYIYNGEERVELRYMGEDFEEGTYTGYVVYGRNSLRAVDRYD